MKRFFLSSRPLLTLLLLCICFVCSSCHREGVRDNSPRSNFESLWKTLDEGYCFFDLKGVDWDEVYSRYSPLIRNDMQEEELFYVLANMVNELRDGHNNLSSYFDYSRYWGWYEDYPANFSSALQKNYLGNDYRVAGPLIYKRIEGNVGYLVIRSFSSMPSDANIYAVLSHFRDCNGMIVDVRQNGGGLITAAEKMASVFFEKRTQVSNLYSKIGPNHDDFSDPSPRYLSPHPSLSFQLPVVLVTNRYCYSAANDFTVLMRTQPRIHHLGDCTGGGGGLPLGSELPNGWNIRFSSSFTTDVHGNNVEEGVEPKEYVKQTMPDAAAGKDSLIEAAIAWINSQGFYISQ